MTFDPTTNRIPYGLLSEDEKTTLIHWPHGWQAYKSCEWVSTTSSNWNESVVCRGKPAPKVTSHWFNVYADGKLGMDHDTKEGALKFHNGKYELYMVRMDICNGEVTVTKETL